jgi:hypothetical protein
MEHTKKILDHVKRDKSSLHTGKQEDKVGN